MGNKYFLKHLKYDLLSSLYHNRIKWILCLGIFTLISDVSIKNCNRIGVAAGYLGYYTYIMQGIPEYIKTETSVFQLPVCWFLFYSYLFFILCFYPVQDLFGNGQRILVLAEGRSKWLYSKICWSILTVIGYYLLFYFSLLCMNFLEGRASRGINGIYEHFGMDLDLISLKEFLLIWIFMPIFFSITIGILQIWIGLLLKPIAAYGISILILITSVYCLNPLMIGNYAMVLRNQPFAENGVTPYWGIILCMVVSAFSVAAGRSMIEKRDIIV